MQPVLLDIGPKDATAGNQEFVAMFIKGVDFPRPGGDKKKETPQNEKYTSGDDKYISICDSTKHHS
jgi:hypothetical protein